ncbi:MAG: GNAT family N-acetyltransferase [Planctomycetota bacterium]|nr:GNAT family N-acetyltransferase [Planctomycetota bacterium]
MIRPYKQSDLEDCLRIFKEVGWMDGEDTDKNIFESYTRDANCLVAELDGAAEVFVVARTGSMRYLNSEIPFSGVCGVVTSHVARQKGLASKVTARSIKEAALNGAAVSMLGMFDQGYYEKFGYGSTTYHRISTFDPASLQVPRLSRAPKRLTSKDAEAMHNCRCRRRRYHGGCNLDGFGETESATIWQKKAFGLGFEGEDGKLTHFLWIKPKGEHGPYSVWFTGWETHGQLLELLSLLKSLSDQVHGVRMADPPDFQIQDFLKRPFATHRARKGGDFDSDVQSAIWMQNRILNLPMCIGAMKLRGEPVAFNLELTDPIEAYLEDDAEWRGVGGNWVICLGPESSAKEGSDDSLPSAFATVNDLSRVWFGSASAESVSLTGNFKADPDLITKIDSIVQLPTPVVDWDF